MARKRQREVDLGAVDDLLSIVQPPAPPSVRRTKDDTRPDAAVPATLSMKRRERDAYQTLADELGMSRSALMRYALLWWYREFRAGRVEMEFEERRNPRVPELP